MLARFSKYTFERNLTIRSVKIELDLYILISIVTTNQGDGAKINLVDKLTSGTLLSSAQIWKRLLCVTHLLNYTLPVKNRTEIKFPKLIFMPSRRTQESISLHAFLISPDKLINF